MALTYHIAVVHWSNFVVALTFKNWFIDSRSLILLSGHDGSLVGGSCVIRSCNVVDVMGWVASASVLLPRPRPPPPPCFCVHSLDNLVEWPSWFVGWFVVRSYMM